MSEVTNVLMTADTVGGVWTYAVELCRALALHGVEVALATMGAPLTDDQRRQADALPNVRVHESGYKLEWMADPWDDVARAGDWLLGIERDFRPDVVHLNGYAHGSLAWESPVLVVGHSCVCSWWQAVKGGPAPAAEWGRYRQAVADGLCGADMVVAPTRAMLSALRRHYDLPPSSTVIHNGRDRSPYRLGAKEPLVLCAGRLWDEAKNLAALEAAAPHLPWPVYAAGEGGDSQRVHTLGRLGEAELAGWFARAAVYALPARYEPFGLSALEAGLSGCALVLGDIDSLREVWGDAAEYVPPADAGALLDALWRLIDSPGRRAEMGRRAYERALRYTPARMAQGYVAAYAETRRGQRERTAAYVTAD
jgi:glycosyltransferase involved in cell wall biosynthesis